VIEIVRQTSMVIEEIEDEVIEIEGQVIEILMESVIVIGWEIAEFCGVLEKAIVKEVAYVFYLGKVIDFYNLAGHDYPSNFSLFLFQSNVGGQIDYP
jgi:Mg2+ and Co2+ transporter CorA